MKIEYFTVLRSGHIHNPSIVEIKGWLAKFEFLRERNDWLQFNINLKLDEYGTE